MQTAVEIFNENKWAELGLEPELNAENKTLGPSENKYNQISDLIDGMLADPEPKRVLLRVDVFDGDLTLDRVRDLMDEIARVGWHEFYIVTDCLSRLARLSPLVAWPQNVSVGAELKAAEHEQQTYLLRMAHARRKFILIDSSRGPLPKLRLSGINRVVVTADSGKTGSTADPGLIREILDQSIGAEDGDPETDNEGLGRPFCRTRLTDSYREARKLLCAVEALSATECHNPELDSYIKSLRDELDALADSLSEALGI